MTTTSPVTEDTRLDTPALYQAAPGERRCARLGRGVLLVLAITLVFTWSLVHASYIARVIALVVEPSQGVRPTRSRLIVQAKYTLWTNYEYDIATNTASHGGALAAFGTARVCALVALICSILFLGLAIALCVLERVFDRQRVLSDATTMRMHSDVRMELHLCDQQRRFEHVCHALSLTPESTTLTPPMSSPETAVLTTSQSVMEMPPLTETSPTTDERAFQTNTPQAVAEAPHEPSSVVIGCVMESASPFALAQWPASSSPMNVANPMHSTGSNVESYTPEDGQPGVSPLTVGVSAETFQAHLAASAAAERRCLSIDRILNCALLALVIALDVFAVVVAINIHAWAVPEIRRWVRASLSSQDSKVRELSTQSSPAGVMAVLSAIASCAATVAVASGRCVGVKWQF